MLSAVLQTVNFAVSSQNRESLIWTLAFGNRTAGKNAEILEMERTWMGNVAGGGQRAEGRPLDGKITRCVKVKSLDLLGNFLPWGSKHCLLGVLATILGLMG